MHRNDAAPVLVKLEGEWSVENAVALLEVVSGRCAQLTLENPGLDRVQIDWSGVADIDACGCQLLVVFLENLRRRGMAPECRGIPAHARERIALLGFSGSFAQTEKEGTA
jgi:anti-anti-sigma regulatory factor